MLINLHIFLKLQKKIPDYEGNELKELKDKITLVQNEWERRREDEFPEYYPMFGLEKGLLSVMGYKVGIEGLKPEVEIEVIDVDLTGVPNVGYEDSNMGGGMFINEVEKNPHAVVLFDEVEKAHRDVSNMLLQVMDYGTVTGSNGKKADCRNITLILTSNLGAEEMEQNNIGFGALERKGADDDALKRFFPPEFRNRLDATVKFDKLGKDTMKKIVKKFLLELNTMTVEKNVEVNANETAIDYLIDKGFDAKLGARPLARIIDEEIKKPLSRMILFGDLQEGGRVEVTIVDDKVKIDYKKPIEVKKTNPNKVNEKTS